MKSKKIGFTLIELMVVVLIVSILAAVMIPILRGRVDAAKWSEGKAILGTIATSVRAYAAEKGPNASVPTKLGIEAEGLGFDIAAGDLDGTYFTNECFTFEVTKMQPLEFTITCTAANSKRLKAPSSPKSYILDQLGNFIEGN